VPRVPRGPNGPSNATDAVVTYARNSADVANDPESAYDAVTADPVAKGNTFSINYPSNAYTYTNTSTDAVLPVKFSSI
jgi:hypothetical protein